MRQRALAGVIHDGGSWQTGAGRVHGGAWYRQRRMRFRRIVVLLAAGCGSSPGTPSDLSPAAKTKWDEYCAARRACLADTNCPPSTCLAPIVEEGPLLEFLDCQNAKACGANDDDCFASAGTTDAERDSFIVRCRTTLNALPTTPACYIDPTLCPIIAQPVIRKQYMRAVDACLTLTCPDLQTCIDDALAPLDCF